MKLAILSVMTLAVAWDATDCAGAAEARIELTVGTLPGAPISGAQEWSQLLGELGLANVSIRSAQSGEKPSIETDKQGSRVVYRVTGFLSSLNELHLPAGRFKPSDRARLGEWLRKLREEGPEVSTASRKPPFGLEAAQLEQVHDDLREKFGVGTAGQRPDALIEKVAAELGYPLEVSSEALAALSEADPVVEELRDVARGTALAAIVRPAGLGFRPLRTKEGDIEYRIAAAKGEDEVWPVGFPLLEKREQAAPQLFEFLTVAIDDITLAEALAAIEPRVKMPMIVDRNALARARIDLSTRRVSLPEKRMTYSLIIQGLLAQAALKWEVRLDERNQPLIWITSVKK